METEKSACMHVIHSLEYGGAQKILYYYAKFHDRERYRVEVATFIPGGEMIAEIETLGVNVHVIGTKSSSPAGFFRLVRIFRESGAKIAHFHNPLPVFLGAPAAAFCGIPVRILTEHSLDYRGRAGGRVATAAYSAFRRRMDRVIACSDEVRASHSNDIDPGRLVTIPNGVDIDYFRTAENTRGNGEEFRICAVGSLTEHKGYRYLIDSVRILVSKGVPARLTLAGEGPLRKELERRAEGAGIGDRVTLVGQVKDVRGILSSSDVIAGSSLREGLPIGMLEAMASGLPVVTTDVGGNREAVVDKETGLLVPARDPAAIAAALETLWRNRDMMLAMGREGRARAEALFSAERLVSDTEKIYDSLRGDSKAGR